MSDFPIDLVVTYVDNTDPVWLADVKQFNVELDPKRYRSWDIFNYWFRGVEKNMPFISTVHLVVSNIEQVPEWVDQDKVHIVLHKDIIPEKYLPTFNSTTIEMFLHKIPGLAEHFIYSNDDMFPLNPSSVKDFFVDGKPLYQSKIIPTAGNIFRMQCRNSYLLACNLAKKTPIAKGFISIRHSMTPMLKSINEEVHQKAGSQILRKCTKFREPFNYTQYLFPNYAMLVDKAKIGTCSFGYFSLSNLAECVQTILSEKGHKIICLNDSGDMSRFEQKLMSIKNAFSTKFPTKSKFERKT